MITEQQQALADHLTSGYPLIEQPLILALEGFRIGLHSNSASLLERLTGYFAHIVDDSAGPADIEVLAIEREAPDLELSFIDWRREPGKTGRKDAYFDLPGARVVQKVRTGMTFLQSEQLRIAAGPCLEHDNQVINFINNQYMTWLQQHGWFNCHAAALEYRGRALAMAGFSGGGKSTLMLHMLERSDTAFISNDRLFIREEAGATLAVGIPKLPRINPGTIVHNPRLQPLLSEQARAELASLPQDQLWELEHKYDADITALYGEGRIECSPRPLAAFMVLNWKRDSDQPLKVERVDLAERRDLLAAIMKSPGPFYQNASGEFHSDTDEFDEDAYLQRLAQVPIYEASGCVDFDALSQRYFELADQGDA